MTDDLTQAIEELRRQTPTDEPWVDDDFFDRPALAAELSTILNAALSGDLIPKADADLAELATLRAQVERLTRALKAANDYLDKGLPERAFNVTRAALTEGVKS